MGRWGQKEVLAMAERCLLSNNEIKEGQKILKINKKFPSKDLAEYNNHIIVNAKKGLLTSEQIENLRNKFKTNENKKHMYKCNNKPSPKAPTRRTKKRME